MRNCPNNIVMYLTTNIINHICNLKNNIRKGKDSYIICYYILINLLK